MVVMGGCGCAALWLSALVVWSVVWGSAFPGLNCCLCLDYNGKILVWGILSRACGAEGVNWIV